MYAFPQSDRNFGTHRTCKNIKQEGTSLANDLQSLQLPVIYLALFYSWAGVGWAWVHLVRRPLAALLYQLRMTDECGVVCDVRLGSGNRSNRRKLTPVPLCSPQIPHNLTWYQTWAARVGSRQPTAWAMALPSLGSNTSNKHSPVFQSQSYHCLPFVFPVPCDDSMSMQNESEVHRGDVTVKVAYYPDTQLEGLRNSTKPHSRQLAPNLRIEILQPSSVSWLVLNYLMTLFQLQRLQSM
jgi:hypothetical protein